MEDQHLIVQPDGAAQELDGLEVIALLPGDDAQLVQADGHQVGPVHQLDIGGARLRQPPLAMRLQPGGEKRHLLCDQVEIFVHAGSAPVEYRAILNGNG